MLTGVKIVNEANMKRRWNKPDGFLEGRGLNKLDFAPRGSRGERRYACSLLWLAGRERTVPSAVLMCEPGADWLRHFELRVDLTTAAESSSRDFFPPQSLASYLALRLERFHCSSDNGITARRSRQTSGMNSFNLTELSFLFARRRASATSCSSLTSSSCCPPARAWAASYSRWAMPSCGSSSITQRPRVESQSKHRKLTQWHSVWHEKWLMCGAVLPHSIGLMVQKFQLLL